MGKCFFSRVKLLLLTFNLENIETIKNKGKPSGNRRLLAPIATHFW